MDAKRQWRRIGPQLKDLGVLTTIDRDALAVYCEHYGRWCEAERRLKKTGLVVKSPSGYPMQSPYLSIANKCMSEMIKILSEFGMTPSSRTRVVVDDKDKPNKGAFARLKEA